MDKYAEFTYIIADLQRLPERLADVVHHVLVLLQNRNVQGGSS